MLNSQLVYLYLLSPLHTGGASQEGNVVGIARETHTHFPYAPSSTLRGRLRANAGSVGQDADVEQNIAKVKFFGPELKDLQNKEFLDDFEVVTDRKLTQLEQGSIWLGDASILWFPVGSLSHGVVWVSCPLLLERWQRLQHPLGTVTEVPHYSSNLTSSLYLKDAQISKGQLQEWKKYQDFIPDQQRTSIKEVLVLPNKHFETLIQMSLWRQVKVKLNDHKVVSDGSFRYEEAIPPDTLMYFPWGTTRQSRYLENAQQDFQQLLNENSILQIGGQESLGRGFVRLWSVTPASIAQKASEAEVEA